MKTGKISLQDARRQVGTSTPTKPKSKHAIRLPDQHLGKARRVDVNNVVQQAAWALANVRRLLDLMRGRLNDLDHLQIPGWVDEFEKSIPAIRKMIKVLKAEGGL